MPGLCPWGVMYCGQHFLGSHSLGCQGKLLMEGCQTLGIMLLSVTHTAGYHVPWSKLRSLEPEEILFCPPVPFQCCPETRPNLCQLARKKCLTTTSTSGLGAVQQ